MAGPSSSRPVGIEDVARAASVSITTVSHALSGNGHVAAATRERVRQVASELGYAPNRLASALRGRRSHILGLVSDDIATTPYATRVVLGAQEAAAERDQLLVVVNSNRDSGIEQRQISSLLSARIDAVIYARMFHQDAGVLPPALDGIPSVLLDTADARGIVRSAVPDEVQIGSLATQTLLDAGHRRIAHLTLAGRGSAVDLRLAAFTEVMTAAGCEPIVVRVEGPATAAAGRDAFTRLLAEAGRDVSAVFCFNDPMAMGVYQVAAAAGMSVPGTLSVIGVDDFRPVAEALLPPLSTISLPHYEMGRWAVETVLALLDEVPLDEAVRSRIPGALIRRESVAAPPTTQV